MGVLSGKTALVTGASSGIGYGCALRFAEEGANILACARHMDDLEKLCEDVNSRNCEGRIAAVRCDVSTEAELDKVVSTAIDEFGRIDILVNAAQGGLGKSAPLLDTSYELSMMYYLGGPMAALRLMQKCFPYMKEQGYGRIINFTSDAARQGMKNMCAYGMCKAAMEALTRTAAVEWGEYGITANCIAPLILTANTLLSARGRAWAEKVAEVNPTRRFGTAYEDCSPILLFLASEASHYLNGETINVTGGGSVPPITGTKTAAECPHNDQ